MTVFLPCIIVSFAFTLWAEIGWVSTMQAYGLVVRQRGSDRPRLSDSISMTGDVITPREDALLLVVST